MSTARSGSLRAHGGKLDGKMLCIFLGALALRLLLTPFIVHADIALHLFQGAAGSLVVLMMYGIGSGIWSRKCGLVAASIGALYPDFIFYGAGSYVDAVSVIIVASVMTLGAMKGREAWRAFAQGLLLGFGTLLQATFLFLVPGVVIAWRKVLLLVAVCAGVAAAAVVSQIITPGSFSPGVELRRSGMDVGTYIGRGDYLGLLDRTYFNAMLLYKAHPGTPTVKTDGSSERINGVFFIRKYSFLAMLLLGFIGLARYFRRDHVPVALPVLVFTLLLAALMRLENARFRSLLEPLLILYASIVFCRREYAPNPIRLKEVRRK
jgi:hypothetical protein